MIMTQDVTAAIDILRHYATPLRDIAVCHDAADGHGRATCVMRRHYADIYCRLRRLIMILMLRHATPHEPPLRAMPPLRELAPLRHAPRDDARYC